ncbi:hypothetical protein D3C81_1561350 [compost metagenome]
MKATELLRDGGSVAYRRLEGTEPFADQVVAGVCRAFHATGIGPGSSGGTCGHHGAVGDLQFG